MWELASHTPVHSMRTAYTHICLYSPRPTPKLWVREAGFIEVSALCPDTEPNREQTPQTDAPYYNPGILVNPHLPTYFQFLFIKLCNVSFEFIVIYLFFNFQAVLSFDEAYNNRILLLSFLVSSGKQVLIK